MNFTKILSTLAIILSIFSSITWSMSEEDESRTNRMLGNLNIDNEKFVSKHAKTDYFDKFINTQHPPMTLVMCVDSRVHSHSLDETPDNDIFTIRNLSGQYKSGAGGILYGVNHLETPLLVIMGHDDCGAVTAKTKLLWIHQTIKNANLEDASRDLKVAREKLKNPDIKPNEREETEKEIQGVELFINNRAQELNLDRVNLLDLINWNNEFEQEVKDELETIAVARTSIPGEDLERFKDIVHNNIKFNTHRQVDACLEKFSSKVEGGHLIIAGALYDFQGKEKEGQERGKLIWLDARDSGNVSKLKNVKSVVRCVNGANFPEEIIPSDVDQNMYNNTDQHIYVFSSIEVEENVKSGLKRLEDRIKTGIYIIETEEKTALVDEQNKRRGRLYPQSKI